MIALRVATLTVLSLALPRPAKSNEALGLETDDLHDPPSNGHALINLDGSDDYDHFSYSDVAAFEAESPTLPMSMMDWLINKVSPAPPEVSKTRLIAGMQDRLRLEGLADEVSGGLVMVVPTNKAWEEEPDLYKELLKNTDEASKLRSDVMFAAGGEMDTVGGWQALLSYAATNGGVVDTAFGTAMKIEPDGRACLAEYDDKWELATTECTVLRQPPYIFKDGCIFLTDHIIMPETLWKEAKISKKAKTQ